jgi:hypothetical protein
MMKKGDEVAVDDNDDVVSVYIALSPYQSGKNVGGGTRRSTRHLGGPSRVHTSQLTLHAIKQGLQCTLISYNYFVTGEDK